MNAMIINDPILDKVLTIIALEEVAENLMVEFFDNEDLQKNDLLDLIYFNFKPKYKFKDGNFIRLSEKSLMLAMSALIKKY